jgi:uncharacterized protein (DUF1015 family)
MPRIYPFRALRPKVGWENKITAKSTDFATHEELVAEVNANPYSSHRVTKSNLVAEYELFPKDRHQRLGLDYLNKMKDQGLLVKEQKDSFYLYRQETESGKSFAGIMALCNLDDYDKHLIKRHENTQSNREKHMSDLFEATGVMGEGVLLAHRHNDELSAIYIDIQKANPSSDFVSIDHKRHRIWVISNSSVISKISEILSGIPEFYIADGHHRFASALRLSHKKKGLRFHFCSVFLIDENQINIFPFYRWIKDTENSIPLNLDHISSVLSPSFSIFPVDVSFYEPNEKGTFGMYFDGKWYKLVRKNTAKIDNDVLSQLDVRLLENKILLPLIGMVDSKTDNRLAYKSANVSLEEFTEKIDDGTYRVGFTLFHVTFEEVKKIADAELIMPPKSTYIEPKLRNGMVIMEY